MSVTPPTMSPEDALTDLKAGNERFVRGEHAATHERREEKDPPDPQKPKAIVLGCIDSRVPVELIFDQSFGDVFVARVAGNLVNDDMLGSMEFATAVAGASLIVVLGHTWCGAVMGALDDAELGHLTPLLGRVRPAIVACTKGGEPVASTNEDLLTRVIDENVRIGVRAIHERSRVIAEGVREGRIRVVGAVYELHTGRVRWLDDSN